MGKIFFELVHLRQAQVHAPLRALAFGLGRLTGVYTAYCLSSANAHICHWCTLS